MADLTTARRLATYRDELAAAGFDELQVRDFLETAAPALVEDVVIQPDIDDTTPVGEVRVRIVPTDVEGDAERIAARVHDQLTRHHPYPHVDPKVEPFLAHLRGEDKPRFASGGIIHAAQDHPESTTAEPASPPPAAED